MGRSTGVQLRHRRCNDLLHTARRRAMSAHFSSVSWRSNRSRWSRLSSLPRRSRWTHLSNRSRRSRIVGVLSIRTGWTFRSSWPGRTWRSLDAGAADGVITGWTFYARFSRLSGLTLRTRVADSSRLSWSAWKTRLSRFSGSSRSARFSLRSSIAGRAGGADHARERGFRFQWDVQAVESRLSWATVSAVNTRLAVDARRSWRSGWAMELDARGALLLIVIGGAVPLTLRARLQHHCVLPDPLSSVLEGVHPLLNVIVSGVQSEMNDGEKDG